MDYKQVDHRHPDINFEKGPKDRFPKQPKEEYSKNLALKLSPREAIAGLRSVRSKDKLKVIQRKMKVDDEGSVVYEGDLEQLDKYVNMETKGKFKVKTQDEEKRRRALERGKKETPLETR